MIIVYTTTTTIQFQFVVNDIIYFIIVYYVCTYDMVQPINFPYQGFIMVSVTKVQ